MLKLKVERKNCLSCGICMDVCSPGALAMTKVSQNVLETDLHFFRQAAGDILAQPHTWMVYPILAQPQACDGCMECARQCPVGVLEIQSADRIASRAVTRMPGTGDVDNNAILHKNIEIKISADGLRPDSLG